MNISIWDEMQAECPDFIQEHDLNVIAQLYRPDHFGNSLVDLECPRIRLRFTRDRGQIWVGVASQLELDSWWPLDDLVSVLRLSSEFFASKEYNADPPGYLTELCNWVDDNFDAIVDSLSAARYPETKQALLQARTRRAE